MNNNMPFKKGGNLDDALTETQALISQAQQDKEQAEAGRIAILMGCRATEDQEENTRFCQTCWRYKQHFNRCQEYVEGQAWPGRKQ